MDGRESDDYASVVGHIRQRRQFLALQARQKKLWWRGSVSEVKQIQRLMSRALGQLGFDYIFSQDGDKVRRFVKFNHCEIRPDEYLLRVDSRKLPRGVNLCAMTEETVIKSLEATIGKAMQYHLSEGGLWFRIFRESGLRNIPVKVLFSDVNSTLTSRDGALAVALGMGENRSVIKFDFQNDVTAHMLIAGSTGTGKTNLIHVIINTLLQKNPNLVKVLLIDLKRTEFPLYNGLPNLIRPVVTDIGEVLDSVSMLHDEMMRRLSLLESGHGLTSNIREYNRKQKELDRLPYWVCIFDEIAFLTDEKTKVTKETVKIFCNIGRLGRAAGIHCVLATQRPDRDVIAPQLKTNFPGKIALACADIASSKVIIDNGDACFHGDIPAGRAIMARGRFRIPFQIAFLPVDLRQSIVGDARAGRFFIRRATHDVTIQELARYALERLDSIFDTNELAPAFAVRGITRHEIRELGQLHRGETFKIDETEYILCQKGRRKPVRIETLEVHQAHSGSQKPDAAATVTPDNEKMEEVQPTQPTAATATTEEWMLDQMWVPVDVCANFMGLTQKRVVRLCKDGKLTAKTEKGEWHVSGTSAVFMKREMSDAVPD